MPASILVSTDLTANSKSANLLAGDINEFITVPSQINIYAVASAITNRISVFADSDIAIDDKQIPVIATSIDNSASMQDAFLVGAGTRLAITLRENGNVSTTDTLVKVEVLPL